DGGPPVGTARIELVDRLGDHDAGERGGAVDDIEAGHRAVPRRFTSLRPAGARWFSRSKQPAIPAVIGITPAGGRARNIFPGTRCPWPSGPPGSAAGCR